MANDSSVEPRNSPGASRFLDLLLSAVTPSLVLLTPFIGFLSYHRYGLTRPESVWLLGIVAAAGILIGMVVAFSRLAARALILGVLVAFSLQTALDLVALRIVLPLCLIAAWLLRTHIVRIVATVFLMMILTTLLLPGERVRRYEGPLQEGLPPPRADLPPVVHLILDEHIGIEGIPSDAPLGFEIREELRRFYAEYGFRLYGKAFAQYSNTYNSVSNLLNFTSLDQDRYYFDDRSEPKVLLQNAYFESLAARGYQFKIYQSEYLDYCQTTGIPVASCYTYPLYSIEPIQEAEILTKEKAAIIFHSFQSGTRWIRRARRTYGEMRANLWAKGWELPAWPRGPDRVAPLTIRPTIKRLEEDLRAQQSGTVFFAHLMFPHGPYAYRSDCSLRPVSEWLRSRSFETVEPLMNTPEGITTRYGLYMKQIRCLQRMLRGFLEVLRETGSLEEATVVIHSDHGSRIGTYSPTTRTRKLASGEDYIAYFSSLFAVKSPDAEPGYDDKLIPQQVLLASVVGVEPDVPDPTSVHLKRKSRGPLESSRMPQFGSASPPARDPVE